MLAKYCSIIRNYVLLALLTKKVHFLPPKHPSGYFSNEFSQHYWQEFFDGDSSVSQSRLDACADDGSQELGPNRMYGLCQILLIS